MTDTTENERLRVLATSDVHMHLLSHNYSTGKPDTSGLEILEPLIAQLREEAAQESPPRRVLLVDNGDMLQGTALGEYIANWQDRRQTHPVASAMNALAYDVMGLGNHDLDYGLANLRWFARGLRAPLVSSNLVTAPHVDWIKPHALVPLGPLKLGFLSVLPPLAVKGLFARLGTAITFRDMRAALAAEARALRRRGADLVVGLAHTGFGEGDNDNILERIAEDGLIDLLVGGHSHHSFPAPDPTCPDAQTENGHLANVPCVMPRHDAGSLGCIDLDLVRNGDGNWQITRSHAQLAQPKQQRPDQSRTRDALANAHQATCDYLDEQISETPRPLVSYFSRVQPSPIQALIAAAQASAIADIARNTRFADLPILSAVAPTRAGGRGGPENFADIPTGPILFRHLIELNTYPNFIWGVDATGRDLRRWLLHAARSFTQLTEDNTPLINSAVPSFDFDTIYGVTYEIDVAEPSASTNRIKSLCFNGSPVADQDRFLVAVNSFRACGGGGFPGLGSDRAVFRPDLFSGDVLKSHLEKGGAAWTETPWRFSENNSGRRTWVDTGPSASNYLSEIEHLSPGTPEPTAGGFLRVPITL